MIDRLGRLMLRAPGNVARALVVECPACHEAPGTPCRTVDGVPEVHDQRESRGYQLAKRAGA